MRRAFASVVLALVALALIAPGAPVGAQDSDPTLTVDRVLVNKTGGITVMGTVDCTAAVAEHWGGLQNVPPDTIVLVNMSWTAWQAVGRKVISATLDDSQASPCWANTAEWLEPGRCVQATGDTWGPCRWDSSNWGSSGYVYGTGKFTTGRVHVQARMTGYFETVPDLIEGFFRISDVDTVAVRDR